LTTTDKTATAWQRYFLPSFVFMSVVIGGGYATGRELVEFFMPAGPLGGLVGMGVAAVVWSVVFALSLEFARLHRVYDYRAFFRELLGPGWIAFEVVYLALLILVLAVLGAATGELLKGVAGTPPWIGTLVFGLLIAALVGLGPAAIERFFSAWGLLLYGAYVIFFVLCVARLGGDINDTLVAAASTELPVGDSLAGGVTYAAYNLAVVPALLFCARYQSSRKESMISGLIAGPVAMLPGILFFIAMLARYPEIAAAPIPLQVILAALDLPLLGVFMQIVIFGTLVQTGLGVIHGFNERLFGSIDRRDARLSERTLRIGISVLLLVVSIVLATQVGLIGLIARGYGYSGWAILIVYVLPLLVIGTWRIATRVPRSAK
jgi:uncharacterized membrane protein YkvI